jgi:flagellar biosynthesis chaperone FliJ
MLLQSYDNISINNKMHGGITIHEIKSTMKFLSSYSNKIKFKQVIPDCVEIDI